MKNEVFRVVKEDYHENGDSTLLRNFFNYKSERRHVREYFHHIPTDDNESILGSLFVRSYLLFLHQFYLEQADSVQEVYYFLRSR
jgi:hypothetical protein